MGTIRGGVVLAIAAVLLIAGCGSSAGPAEQPTITGAWVRVPMGEGRPAGGYLSITAPTSSPDALIAARSPVAMRVEIHETVTDASGTTGMRQVPRVDVPAGATVRLEPGGHHLMLLGVASEALIVGTRVEITLTFERAGEITIRAEVRQG
jgi:periplasmic copper chaperone A